MSSKPENTKDAKHAKKLFNLNKFSFQQMSSEFDKWMKFYGKECGSYDLLKGNFLSDDFKDIISNAT